MSEKQPYNYTVLRYVHDTATAEFVNVGVVLHCASYRFLRAKLRRTHRRLSALFPGFDSLAFRNSMRAIEAALNSVGAKYAEDDLLRSETNALQIAQSVLPADDSSLQWSPLGSGLTSDPASELDHLFSRLVSKYDEPSEHRRSDADIWRPVRERLAKANLTSKLRSKVIRGSIDELEFKHAWKNGVWHCCQALSFDLADADGIKRKAREWMGHLTAVSDAPEKFKPYFIVGAPSNINLMPAYGDALAILKKTPVEPEVFPESEADKFVDLIEAELSRHP